MKHTLFIVIALLSSGCGNQGNTTSSLPVKSPLVQDDSVATNFYCVSGDSGSGIQLDFQYENTTFNTGDHLITCSVVTSTGQYTQIEYFRSGSVGGAQGFCSPVADIDTPGFGYWTFTSISGTTKAVYTDSGSTHNGYTFTFTGANCQTN